MGLGCWDIGRAMSMDLDGFGGLCIFWYRSGGLEEVVMWDMEWVFPE